MTDALDKARQDEMIGTKGLAESFPLSISGILAYSNAADLTHQETKVLFERLIAAELDAAKQRIAELELWHNAAKVLHDEMKRERDEARAQNADAHRTGFLECQRQAVECVPTNWLHPSLSHMLGGKALTNSDVEAAMRAVAQAISQLKPEGE